MYNVLALANLNICDPVHMLMYVRVVVHFGGKLLAIMELP